MLKFLRRKTVKPVRTIREFDLTKTWWGHSFEVEPSDKSLGYKGWVWLTPSPHVGDQIRWKTEYGEAVLEITFCEWTRNVSDMYKVELKVIGRVFNAQG